MTTVIETPRPQTQPPPSARPRPAAAVRGIGVVMGGPVLLDALEVLGPISAVRRWPARLQCARSRRAAWALTAIGAVAPAVDHGLVRPWLRRWGATPEERSSPLPGDGERRPMFTTTRAVTVHAPATEVWAWLVQIGQDRGGFYSYDWLENLAGCQITSADSLHEEWQQRVRGDALTIFPGYATRFTEVDPPHAVVIEGWGAYVIEPIDERSCRLLARSRAERDLGGLAYVLLIELPHAVMERRMLLGIKQRAERHLGERD